MVRVVGTYASTPRKSVAEVADRGGDLATDIRGVVVQPDHHCVSIGQPGPHTTHAIRVVGQIPRTGQAADLRYFAHRSVVEEADRDVGHGGEAIVQVGRNCAREHG